MNNIILENFRCFREKQEARLAPLTLLIGENSTGKTSFLAMIRALWDVAFRQIIPNFKEEPYDLGTFDEIVHHRGSRVSRSASFMAGADLELENSSAHYEVTFEKEGTVPVPVKRTMEQNDILVEHRIHDGHLCVRFGIPKKEWKWKANDFESERIVNARERLDSFGFLVGRAIFRMSGEKNPSPKTTAEVNLWRRLRQFDRQFFDYGTQRLFPSAPVQAKPRRTYDPARLTRDSEGNHIPMYLAHMHFYGGKEWENLKNALEGFGRMAGLFDEISVKHFGNIEGGPFQLQIRKFGSKKAKGPFRNWVDVGYGVSQVIPVVTELLRHDAPNMFLMQQPEGHLHPSAQAALGSLFCSVARANRQLVVETHSDYLLDRVRMDIRDGKSKLKPDDVSILYFERAGLDVRIHSLRLDDEGQICDAPPSYRTFFMDEIDRRLKLRNVRDT